MAVTGLICRATRYSLAGRHANNNTSVIGESEDKVEETSLEEEAVKRKAIEKKAVEKEAVM